MMIDRLLRAGLFLVPVFVSFMAFPNWAELAPENEPRLAKPDVSRCVEAAKGFLRAQEFDEQEEELNLIGACRDADATCVQTVGEHLASSERASAQKFLPVIRACRGRGMGDCYNMAISRMASFDYRDSDQAVGILKKCE